MRRLRVPWVELLALAVSALLLLPLAPTVLPRTWARFTEHRIRCFHCRADGCDRSELEHVCAVYRPPPREDPVVALEADLTDWIGDAPRPPDPCTRYFATGSGVIYYTTAVWIPVNTTNVWIPTTVLPVGK